MIIILEAIRSFPGVSYFHIGDVFSRVCTVLEEGKHIAATPAFTEVQIEIVTTGIAFGMVLKTVLILNGNDFDIRQHLCPCGTKEKVRG